MKKLLLTITCSIMFLLCIPFNTLAIEYDDDISNLENITDLQLSKIQELYNIHTSENLVIFYSFATHNLSWSYNIVNYDSSSKDITIGNRFILNQEGTVSSAGWNLTINLNQDDVAILYLYYSNNTIFSNSYLFNHSNNINTLLLSTSYENISRSHSTSAAMNPRTRYYSYVDYDIRYTIKGSIFDVYYLVNDTYQLIQSSINTFTIINHDSKSKFKDSSTPDDYPDFPTIPNDSLTTYSNKFTLHNFLFIISEPKSNELLVKAPDTDKLISDGNSNSQSATSNNNQSNQLLDNTVNQMESLENGFKNDLNSNLNNINSNDFNISGITQLSNASNFVKVQFDNLTKNNPFGTILGFSLFLGLSLLIIGKRL